MSHWCCCRSLSKNPPQQSTLLVSFIGKKETVVYRKYVFSHYFICEVVQL